MSLHIAVILPERYRGGTLRGAKNIARMLSHGARKSGDKVRVTFGHIDDDTIYEPSDFRDLRAAGIGVRPFRLDTMRAEYLNPYFKSGVIPSQPTSNGEYLVFNDGMSNFEEADFWVLVSDRVFHPLPAHRRYAVVVYDYIQRYVPGIFGLDAASEGAWRAFDQFAKTAAKADFVICTTHQTRQDCISYTGTAADRVHVFPMEFDPIAQNKLPDATAIDGEGEEAPYLLWTTNSTEHKNHINLLEGLERFFRANPTSNLKVRMSGVYTHLFTESGKGDKHFDLPYPKKVRRKLQELPLLSKRLSIVGNVPDDQYLGQLRGAAFVLHGALYDNGTYSVVEGAWMGVPSISSDYPAMREVSRNFSLPLSFFDPRDPDSIAQTIASAVRDRDAMVRVMPSQQTLQQRSFEVVAPQYWEKFVAAVRRVERF